MYCRPTNKEENEDFFLSLLIISIMNGQKILVTSGTKLRYRIVARRSGDVPQMYASTDKANQELGWKTRRSLDEMTASAWNWEQRVRGL